MVYFIKLSFGFLILLDFYLIAHSQLNETAFTSDAQCYGAGLFVNATCPTSSSIALNNIRVGTRPTAHGCHGNETTGDGTGCCESSSDTCEFDFPISDNVLYQDQCNGRQLCRPGVQRIDVIHGSCNTSVYPQFTQCMYLNYFCIDDNRIGDMEYANLAVENATVYLQSPNYPTSNISSGVSKLSCSVETDNCDAVILIYVIERNLAEVVNSTQCDQTQSLSIIEEDGSTLANWTCNDNTYTISQPLQTAGNYILVNFTNTMTTDGGKFWTGFKASLQASLTLECPAVYKQHCLPSSTTTGSSSTSTSTTAPSTTTTTKSSTKSSSTTSKTSTSSTSSTTSTTSTSTTSITTRTSSSTTTTKSTSRSLSTQGTAELKKQINTTPRNNNKGTTLKNAAAVYGCIGFVAGIVLLIGLFPRSDPEKKENDAIKPGIKDHRETTKTRHSSGGGSGGNTQPPVPPNGPGGKYNGIENKEDPKPAPGSENGPGNVVVIITPPSPISPNGPRPKSPNGPVEKTNGIRRIHVQPNLPNGQDGSIFCPRYYGHLHRIYPSITEGEIIRETKRSGFNRGINFLTFRHQRLFRN